MRRDPLRHRAQRRSRRIHDGYRMAPGELPCELAVNPLRQALPRPVSNAVTGLSVAAARLGETTESRRGGSPFAKGAPIHMTFGAPAQVAVESVEDVEYSASLRGRSHLIVRSLIAKAS